MRAARRRHPDRPGGPVRGGDRRTDAPDHRRTPRRRAHRAAGAPHLRRTAPRGGRRDVPVENAWGAGAAAGRPRPRRRTGRGPARVAAAGIRSAARPGALCRGGAGHHDPAGSGPGPAVRRGGGRRGCGRGHRDHGRQPLSGRRRPRRRADPVRIGRPRHRPAPLDDAARGESDLDARRSDGRRAPAGRVGRRCRDRGAAGHPLFGRGLRGRGLRALRLGAAQGPLRAGVPRTLRPQRDARRGVADHGRRGARPRRRHRAGGARGAGPGHRILRELAHALLVRRRLRAGLPADRPARGVSWGRRATRRTRAGHAEPGVCESGVHGRRGRADGRRRRFGHQEAARGTGRGRNPRGDNGFAGGLRLRAGRGARQAGGGRGGRRDARRGAAERAPRVPVHAHRPGAGDGLGAGRRRCPAGGGGHGAGRGESGPRPRPADPRTGVSAGRRAVGSRARPRPDRHPDSRIGRGPAIAVGRRGGPARGGSARPGRRGVLAASTAYQEIGDRAAADCSPPRWPPSWPRSAAGCARRPPAARCRRRR
ncbi:Uncharacterised protein [Mycolicibacterium chitae]|uniref:Uncharacterized protein n=1 Tax=Mycolicibacterium chitae TaxID=1792 RepID=A0A448IBS9_MYCCI|nr:Uncharacterised protein [Mycolicibacterium chitae]